MRLRVRATPRYPTPRRIIIITLERIFVRFLYSVFCFIHLEGTVFYGNVPDPPPLNIMPNTCPGFCVIRRRRPRRRDVRYFSVTVKPIQCHRFYNPGRPDSPTFFSENKNSGYKIKILFYCSARRRREIPSFL